MIMIEYHQFELTVIICWEQSHNEDVSVNGNTGADPSNGKEEETDARM